MKAIAIKLIQTYSLRGAGTEESPKRRVTEYWTEDGKLLAESDPNSPIYSGTFDGTDEWYLKNPHRDLIAVNPNDLEDEYLE